MSSVPFTRNPVDSALNLSWRALSRTTPISASSNPLVGLGLDLERELHLGALGALQLHDHRVQDRVERFHRPDHVDFDRAVEAARLARAGLRSVRSPSRFARPRPRGGVRAVPAALAVA